MARRALALLSEAGWVLENDVLRKNGPIGGEALQSVRNAKTLRFRNGKVVITDGPYAETKEQIGGFFSFEARDMDEAVRLVSNHPGLKAGPFEIRPVEDMTEVVRESERLTRSFQHPMPQRFQKIFCVMSIRYPTVRL